MHKKIESKKTERKGTKRKNSKAQKRNKEKYLNTLNVKQLKMLPKNDNDIDGDKDDDKNIMTTMTNMIVLFQNF